MECECLSRGIFWASVLDNDRMGTKPPRDKGEGGRERGVRERKQMKAGEERWGFELMLSQRFCDDCHRGSAWVMV